MGRLDGHVIIVTGAARGLGAVTTRLGVEQGGSVVMIDVNDEAGEGLAAELGDGAIYRHLDVRDKAGWNLIVDLAESEFGHLDGLINNAGIHFPGGIETGTEEDFRRLLEVNTLGPFLGIQAAVPAMRRHGCGSIVNVGSAAALHGLPGMAGYTASKWALRGMSKAVAQEIGQYGIRVNCVHPGGILTDMSRAARKALAAARGPGENVPAWAIPRFPELHEVSNLCLYLITDEATFTTGADVPADGGVTIGPRFL